MSCCPPRTTSVDENKYQSIKSQKAHLILLKSFIPPPFAERISNRHLPARIAIIRAVKLNTPHLDDMHETLQQDTLDPLIEFRHPMLKVRVPLQIQTVDLKTDHQHHVQIDPSKKRTAA
jgi:hypothetical protein